MNWIPISTTKHRDKALKRDRDYNFAKSITLVPVHLEDLFISVAHMPLVFYQINEVTEMVAVLGLENGQNLFVGDDGSWPIDFVPAVFRCHPFSAVDMENGESTLAFREDSDLIVDRSHGDPLFNVDGSESQVFKSLAALAVAIKKQRVFLRAACSLLSEFELLQPLSLKFQKEDGAVLQLGNVYGINKNKLNELEGKKFTKLRETSAIDVVYAHLFSLNSFSILLQIMNARQKITSNLNGLGLEIFADKEAKMDFSF